MTKTELLTLARNLGVRRTSSMNTTQLRDAIARQRAWLATPAADVPKTTKLTKMRGEQLPQAVPLGIAAAHARDWTLERDRLIRELRSEGLTSRAIGEIAGLSHTAIVKIVARS